MDVIRKVVIDTETTHLDVNIGRVFEIGCVEIINNQPTGNEYHVYLNPEIEISTESIAITGMQNHMLQDKPLFSYIAHELYMFLENATLIAHNAKFDIAYLNKEFQLAGYSPLNNIVIDTLEIARKKYKTNNSLDGLAKKFEINLEQRDKHGAIIDARILSHVYYYLQRDNMTLQFEDNNIEVQNIKDRQITLIYDITANDLQNHNNFLSKLNISPWEY